MAKNRQTRQAVKSGKTDGKGNGKEPRSLVVASKGIKSDADFSNLMCGLMADLIEGRVSPGIGNATCNAGGKLLKVVEMRYKYGAIGKTGTPKTLLLNLKIEDDAEEDAEDKKVN